MKRMLHLILAVLPVMVVGCQSMGMVVDAPPVFPIGGTEPTDHNPVYIPLAVNDYGKVFETVLQTLGDYGFEFGPGDANRFSGQIEALPRTSPGLGLLFKPGSPDLYFRVLSTTQSYRHRVSVIIQPADLGGFFVEFIARKELEDIPRPIRATAGSAVFRTENTAERQDAVIDATFFQPNWLFKGRDTALEQELIRRFKLAL